MPEFVTRDPAFEDLLELARRAATTTAGVLLTGESGVGKNRLARYIHDRSGRADGPYVEVPCANLPADLLESELLGHEEGAFTGASGTREGRFEQADGGTVYLDEIQELRPELQAKVLRVVEEKRFERLGGGRTLEVDVRIIASTREEPGALVAEGRLREDLYYRMNVVHLHIPPIRHRPGDIPSLAMEFLREACESHRLGPRRLDEEAMDRLREYPWPGNARELRHAVESAAVLATAEVVTASDLPASLSVGGEPLLRAAAARGRTLAEVEEAYIREVLHHTRGNKSAAARILGIHRKTLHEKLRAMDPAEDRGS